MNLAPNKVSGRVVKISSSLSLFGVVAASSAKRINSPSERPIQFFCISLTLSGQRSKRVERVQQFFRIVADLEHPLIEIALLDHGARAPAAAVDHLFVGEHGVVDRVPVHFAILARHQARFPEVEKHFLLVLVVGRIAGRDLARPVERQAHRLELRLHRRDVVVGPLPRM